MAKSDDKSIKSYLEWKHDFLTAKFGTNYATRFYHKKYNAREKTYFHPLDEAKNRLRKKFPEFVERDRYPCASEARQSLLLEVIPTFARDNHSSSNSDDGKPPRGAEGESVDLVD